MAKVYLSEAKRLCQEATKRLHGELYAEGIRNKDIAEWLNCSEQNICQHWKKSSFSYGQILVMQNRLEGLRNEP